MTRGWRNLCAFPECVRELREDVDFPGSDILQILTPDVHHCQLACSQHHQCLFFTFIRSDWNRDNRYLSISSHFYQYKSVFISISIYTYMLFYIPYLYGSVYMDQNSRN